MAPASDISPGAEFIQRSLHGGFHTGSSQTEKDYKRYPNNSRHMATDVPHYVPPDAGWQWQFRELFGDTQAYMTHNEVAGKVETEQPGFWKLKVDPAKGEIGSKMAPDAGIWNDYLEETKRYDSDMIERWNGNMDVLLVFAGLFSAVLTAFIIEFYRLLQPDSSNTSTALLADIALSLRCQADGPACSLPDQLLPAKDSKSTSNAQWINLLWFTSLTLSLTVSALALLVKQWAQAYRADLNGPPHAYARLRQFRFDGVKCWHMPAVIGSLPLLLYLALMMFLAGLAVLLQSLDSIIFSVSMSIIAMLVMFYTITTMLPLFYASCPYRTLSTKALQYGLSILVAWVNKVLSMLQVEQMETAMDFSILSGDYKLQEANLLQTTGGQLDAEALAWLVSHSNDQNTVQQALKATAGLSPQFKGFNPIKTADMVSRILQCLESCVSADQQSLPGMEQDVACYFQGLYLVLQQGDPTSDIFKKASLINIDLLAMIGPRTNHAFHEVPLLTGDEGYSPIWEETYTETGLYTLALKRGTSECSGVYTLFGIHTLLDCVWILKYLVDNQLLMSPSTLCLLLKRLCALHLQSPEDSLSSTVSTLCILLYSESFSPTFGPGDRVCRLIVITLYMLTCKSIDIAQVQAETLQPQGFEKFLLEGLVVVLSHDDQFNLESSSIQKLLLLLVYYWDRHKRGTIFEAYSRCSWAEQGNFMGMLLAHYGDFDGPVHWNALVDFLRLPLSTNFVPPEASELCLQYLQHTESIDPSAYAMLYAMSDYIDHSIILASSDAWKRLVWELRRSSDEAFQLVGHTLLTIVTHVHAGHIVFEKLQADSLFHGLGKYLDSLNGTFSQPKAIHEWIMGLIGLCPRYKAQILHSNLSPSLTRVVADMVMASGLGLEFLLMKLEMCLEE